MLDVKNVYNLIAELNNKYQFVKKNKYWDYDEVYNFDNNIINENDMLYELSDYISKRVDSNKIDVNSLEDYEIPNIDYEQMKKIVSDFFLSIDPNYSSKLSYIFSNIKVIYESGRSVSTPNGIQFYCNNNLSSLVTLAHEVSHCLSCLDDNLKISDENKIGAFAEIESELTEELFLDNLLKSNFSIIDKKSSSKEIRLLTEKDINNIKYNKYFSSVIRTIYRVLDEIPFKMLMKNNNLDSITDDLITQICNMKHIVPNDDNKKMICSRIDMFLNPYYPSNSDIKNISNGYDLFNGKHLSNESRFIYAYLFVSKFNQMNMTADEKKDFYKRYINDVKNLSFSDTLKRFGVDSLNLSVVSDDFINEYTSITKNVISHFKISDKMELENMKQLVSKFKEFSSNVKQENAELYSESKSNNKFRI